MDRETHFSLVTLEGEAFTMNYVQHPADVWVTHFDGQSVVDLLDNDFQRSFDRGGIHSHAGTQLLIGESGPIASVLVDARSHQCAPLLLTSGAFVRPPDGARPLIARWRLGVRVDSDSVLWMMRSHTDIPLGTTKNG